MHKQITQHQTFSSMETYKTGITLKPATRSDIATHVKLRIIFLKEIQGICSLLFEQLIAEAMKYNLDKVELDANSEGEPVYRKFGFTEPHDIALELILN